MLRAIATGESDRLCQEVFQEATLGAVVAKECFT